ncbi:MAG: hypothetical protein ACTHN5_04800 [Phycisphaerae bacterium]
MGRLLATGLVLAWVGAVWAAEEGSPLLIDPKTLPPEAPPAAPAKDTGKAAAAPAATRPAARSGERPANLLTEAELTRLFHAGAYEAVVSQTGTDMRLTDYHGYPVYMMRGESYLHLAGPRGAAVAFLDAAKWAPDEEKRTMAYANAILCMHSSGMFYAAQTTDEQGNPLKDPTQEHAAVRISVVDPAARPAAIRAVYHDVLHAATIDGEKARTARTMGEYAGLIREVKELSPLEQVVTGKQEQTQHFREQTVDEINVTIAQALAGMKQRVEILREKIETGRDSSKASGVVADGRGDFHPVVPKDPPGWGLSGHDSEEANAILATAHQVGPAMERYARDLSVDKKVFAKVAEDGATLEKMATALLKESGEQIQRRRNAK